MSSASGAEGGPSASVAPASAGGAAEVKEKKVDSSRWVIVYPAYLDSRRTGAQGRRISREIAINAPHAIEIYKIVTVTLKLGAHLELNKTYPSDFFTRGRVRVNLFDGTTRAPLSADINCRKALMQRIAKAFPAFRAENGSMEKHGDPFSLITTSNTKTSDTAGSSKGSGAGSSSSASTSNKKKNKGRR